MRGKLQGVSAADLSAEVSTKAEPVNKIGSDFFNYPSPKSGKRKLKKRLLADCWTLDIQNIKIEVNNMTTLSELKKLRKPIENVNIKHRKSFTRLERFAVWITDHIGTMGFFLLILIWTAGWLLWNLLAPVEWRFDTVPAFALWLFISNMLQLFLMPLIMIGQNLQGRHAEMRAESDFEINLKAEREIEAILAKLEEQEKLISKILEYLLKRLEDEKK